MGISKIQRGDGTAIFDISGDTVTAETLAQGATAHGADGEPITGTATSGVSPPSAIKAGDQIVMLSPTIKLSVSGASGFYEATGAKLTIPRTGTYRFQWVFTWGYSFTTFQTRLYKNGTAAGTSKSHTGDGDAQFSEDMACAAGDTIEVWLKGASKWGTLYGAAGNLAACINWDIGL